MGSYRVISRVRLVVLACVVGVALSASAGAQQAADHFPETQARSLAGEEVMLPEALKGKVGVLVVGFTHASQGEVRAWGARLNQDFAHSDRVIYFEIAMLAGAPKILRGMIVKKMGSSIAGTEREHFLPVTEHEAGWQAAAHYKKGDEACVLLVDPSGAVVWQTSGAVTNSNYGELKKRVDELISQRSQ